MSCGRCDPRRHTTAAVRRRVALAWGLMFLNVLTFYKGTWNGLPLIVPIPSVIGKLMTQGALPPGCSWRGP